MNTIDNIMALALNYRLAGSASRDEHEEALRTALTEALAQSNHSEQHLEMVEENVQAQPLIWRELAAWWESGGNQWGELRAIVQRMALAEQPVPQYNADPSCTTVALSEMILSDCGCSSNNTALVSRVANRIDAHMQAAQPVRQPLSQEQMWSLWNSQGSDEMNQTESFAFARAIELAHGIWGDK